MTTTLLAIPAARTDLTSRTTAVYRREEPVLMDTKLIAILDAPLSARETPTQGFDRRERDLGNAFALLSIDQAAAMFDRLVVNYTGDVLARKFNRLSEERRARLLDFLDVMADPVRRHGIMSAMA